MENMKSSFIFIIQIQNVFDSLRHVGINFTMLTSKSLKNVFKSKFQFQTAYGADGSLIIFEVIDIAIFNFLEQTPHGNITEPKID